ncbi:MAG: flagellar basal-body MS-ring/collar protein FliF [Proteobacteria bacterium]|nr:flagellar basal-body MS-ring/collar protein FliF [Pseudomonadota bacterium]
MAATELLLNNAKSYITNVPKNKLYLYLFLFVSIVGGSVLGLSFLQKEDYQTLFSGLAVEDASMIVAKLKEQKVPYKLGLGGTTVYVPKEKVYDVRLLLASQNALPGNSGVGFELFDKTNYGMTEFMQNINYKRAIQGELARTINQMPEVKTSRVHIALPERTLFYDREKQVTASIFLKLKPGKALPKEQVAGIVQFVASSIEGLKAENITVIDSSGKILYKSGDASSPIVLSGQQYELQKNVERKFEESIQSLLNTFLPASRSIVRASVELNLRKVETVEEEYNPEKAVVATSKKSREMVASRAAKAGGVPGVASNTPNAPKKEGNKNKGNQENPDKAKESEREEEHKTYELTKTIRKIVEPYGDIKKLSLAVVVDGKYEKVKGQKGEESRYAPRSQKELQDIKNLIARAVGYNEQRGDKLEVQSAPFEIENVAEDKSLLESSNKKEMIYNIGKYVFYLAILLSIFTFVVKPVIGLFKDRAGSIAMRQVSGIKDTYAGSKGAINDASAKGGADSTPVLSKAQPAFASALQDKALVKSIIKEWVRERS